jgi:hypothetical protein
MMTVRGQNDPAMGHRRAQTQIRRRDVGVNADMLLHGRLVTGKEVLMTIQGELLESSEDPAGAAT